MYVLLSCNKIVIFSKIWKKILTREKTKNMILIDEISANLRSCRKIRDLYLEIKNADIVFVLLIRVHGR